MKASVDTHVNNLSNKICNQKRKYCLKCKFATMFDYLKKDVEKSILLLRKGVMCCVHIDSWG